ncbi:histidine kinase [Streptomyces sp. ODS28]|uniref:sensor histidine kinase n=1 Tax=Streptomyces sp. ODS28 TaxID=3136688 RepID=UPI0031EAB6CD
MTVPRRRHLAAPHRDDALIALAGLLGGLVLWALGLYSNPVYAAQRGDWTLAALAAMCLAALGRRTAQPWALGLAVIATAADMACGSLVATLILFSDVVYAAVLYGSRRLARVVPPASVAATVAVTFAVLAVFRKPEALLLGVLCGALTIAPAWTGTIVRDHRNAAAAERLRAEQTALLAEMDRAQAVTAERARMARELHDVVANHLSAIAIRSTAVQAMDPEGAETGAAYREALGVIRENSVRGLAEMRRLIGLLREAEGAGAPEPSEEISPTLDGLDALLERARSGEHRGTAAARHDFVLRDERPPGPLPAPVELAAYRIVQESVTNALKHAAPGTVTVALRQEGHGVEVCVSSPLGGEPAAERDVPGSGAGLIGMRERVELLGGELSAGPEGDRWTVRARLPVTGAGESAE